MYFYKLMIYLLIILNIETISPGGEVGELNFSK